MQVTSGAGAILALSIPVELSAGQQQRVEIAYDLMLFDEPNSALPSEQIPGSSTYPAVESSSQWC